MAVVRPLSCAQVKWDVRRFEDGEQFSIAQLTGEDGFKTGFARGVMNWWVRYGKKATPSRRIASGMVHLMGWLLLWVLPGTAARPRSQPKVKSLLGWLSRLLQSSFRLQQFIRVIYLHL